MEEIGTMRKHIQKEWNPRSKKKRAELMDGDKRSIQKMSQFLAFSDKSVRVAAYQALMQLGEDALVALPNVLTLLDEMAARVVAGKVISDDASQAAVQALTLAGHLLHLKLELANAEEDHPAEDEGKVHG